MTMGGLEFLCKYIPTHFFYLIPIVFQVFFNLAHLIEHLVVNIAVHMEFATLYFHRVIHNIDRDGMFQLHIEAFCARSLYLLEKSIK